MGQLAARKKHALIVAGAVDDMENFNRVGGDAIEDQIIAE
jgi:hypothetical protein